MDPKRSVIKGLRCTSRRFFLNCQQMGKVIMNFCWHQNFVPKGLSVPALGLYTCIKLFKMCLKSCFKEIVLKLATNGQSDKGFLLTSAFVPKGLSAPALGLYTCIKALKYIPGPGVRWAFTGPLVLWFYVLTVHVCLNKNKTSLFSAQFHLRIKIRFFSVHRVMKPVGGAKILWSASPFL